MVACAAVMSLRKEDLDKPYDDIDDEQAKTLQQWVDKL